MRLKEDSDSWHASGLIKRDYRHDSSQPNNPKHKAKKDTAKWCKGKVGVPHQWESKSPPNDRGQWRKFDICANCGRQSYKNVTYYCRKHDVWDKRVYWTDEHTHGSS